MYVGIGTAQKQAHFRREDETIYIKKSVENMSLVLVMVNGYRPPSHGRSDPFIQLSPLFCLAMESVSADNRSLAKALYSTFRSADVGEDIHTDPSNIVRWNRTLSQASAYEPLMVYRNKYTFFILDSAAGKTFYA